MASDAEWRLLVYTHGAPALANGCRTLGVRVALPSVLLLLPEMPFCVVISHHLNDAVIAVTDGTFDDDSQTECRDYD